MSDMLSLLQQAVEKRLLRPLDIQFAQLVVPESQPARLLAAACVSAEAGEGHVCFPLSNLCEAHLFAGRQPALAQAIWQAAGAPDDWLSHFADWPAVSDGSRVTPLVLSNQRLYLHRLWQSEGRVVDFFAAHEVKTAFDIRAAGDVLNSLFDDQPENWQKIAAAVALTRKTAVISGGPGTGKTTTVAKLLAALIRLNPGALRIQLAAPTAGHCRIWPSATKNGSVFLPKPLRCIACWALSRIPSGYATMPVIRCIWMCWLSMKRRWSISQ